MVKVKRVLGIVTILLLVLVASFTLLPVQAAEPPENIEDLQKWVDEQGYNYTVAENWVTQLSPGEREGLCGYQQVEAPQGPLPENLAFVSDVPAIETGRVGQPASYDAMALGYVTPVKNQGNCGSCWLFGATADFESDVAIGGDGLLNFAEQEVGDCNIWSSVGGYNFCNGGIALMTTNYFTTYGSAYEACHPYVATPGTCQSCALIKSVNNWRTITGSSGDSQITTIKNAILAYGPVYATIYAGDAGFSAYNSGVYSYAGTEDPNHAIEIIGWDDTLGTAGAWMIKNSWGTSWAASGPYPGCAWVAYGSANLGDDTSAISGYENPPLELFYHDECGWMNWCYGDGALTNWGAVRFTPLQNETLTAVDFWADDFSMGYEIKIFDTLTDESGGDYSFGSQLGSTQVGITGSEMGYYSIPLTTPVSLVGGNDFIVQVKLTNSWGYPIPIDYYDASSHPWLPAWSSIATFSGESYFSSDGATFTKPAYDFGIRARATGSPGTGLLRVQTDPAAPTTIFLDDIPRNGWGLDWVKMPAGTYMLSFSDVYGYNTPTTVDITYYPLGGGPPVGPVTQPLSEPIVIYGDAVTEVIVHFIQLGNLWVQTSPALPATLSLNGYPMNDWGFWVFLEAGDYLVFFQDIGYGITPPATLITVIAGVTTHVIGNYDTGETIVNP